MPSFVWKGKNRFGAFQEGVLLADNRDVAVATLRRQNIQVTSIREPSRSSETTRSEISTTGDCGLSLIDDLPRGLP